MTGLHKCLLMLGVGLSCAAGQTRLDLNTQIKGLEKQGDGVKFQMAGSTIRTGGIAVYDSAGNAIASGCGIEDGTLFCGDGEEISTITLPELGVNGENAFVIHGAPEQQADGCIVLSGQPAEGQVLRATGTTLIDEESRPCVVMEWVKGTELGSVTPSPNTVPKADGSGVLAPGWLPAPSTTAKGGVQAKVCRPEEFVQALNVDGSVTCAQPALVEGGALSVGLSMPPEFNVTGSPLTANGTIAVTANAQPANKVLAGPANGGAAAPAYRSLTQADLPRAVIYSLAQFANVGVNLNTSVRVFGHYLPYPVTASNIAFQVLTGDSTGIYSVGLYGPCSQNSECPLAAHTTPASYDSAGLKDIPFAEGTVTLPAGRYYLAYAGNASVLRLDRGEYKATFANGRSVGGWSGEMPATITTPEDSWQLWSAGIAAVIH